MADVIVIGAGLAGLRCATDLVAAGADVVVLEARARVGGRVWSHTFSDGQVAERGAEFIDGNHREVLALAAHLGLPLTTRDAEPDPRATLVDAGGRAVPMHLHASVAADLGRWEAAIRGLDADDPALEDGSLVMPFGPGRPNLESYWYVLLWQPGRRLSPVQQAFRDWIAEAARADREAFGA